MEFTAPWVFAAVAAGMVGVAVLFWLPRQWRIARADAEAKLPDGAPGLGPRWRRVAVLLARLALPVAACALYLWLSDRHSFDSRRAALHTQLRDADAAGHDAAAEQLHVELQLHLQRQPEDALAWVQKARLDMLLQRYGQAAEGFEHALHGKPKGAVDAGVWVEYAEAQRMLQGGRMAGLPRQRVDKALSLNPDHAQALDLAGSAAWEAGEFGLAAAHWKRLLVQFPEDSPRHVQVSRAIQRAEQRARFGLPPVR